MKRKQIQSVAEKRSISPRERFFPLRLDFDLHLSAYLRLFLANVIPEEISGLGRGAATFRCLRIERNEIRLVGMLRKTLHEGSSSKLVQSTLNFKNDADVNTNFVYLYSHEDPNGIYDPVYIIFGTKTRFNLRVPEYPPPMNWNPHKIEIDVNSDFRQHG